MMKNGASFHKPSTKMNMFRQGRSNLVRGKNKVYPLRDGKETSSAAYAEKKQELIKEYQEWRKAHLEKLKEELRQERAEKERQMRGESKQPTSRRQPESKSRPRGKDATKEREKSPRTKAQLFLEEKRRSSKDVGVQVEMLGGDKSKKERIEQKQQRDHGPAQITPSPMKHKDNGASSSSKPPSDDGWEGEWDGEKFRPMDDDDEEEENKESKSNSKQDQQRLPVAAAAAADPKLRAAAAAAAASASGVPASFKRTLARSGTSTVKLVPDARDHRVLYERVSEIVLKVQRKGKGHHVLLMVQEEEDGSIQLIETSSKAVFEAARDHRHQSSDQHRRGGGSHPAPPRRIKSVKETYLQTTKNILSDEEAEAHNDSLFFICVVILGVYFLAGILFYIYREGWSFLDSLYFSVATLTTVGYGDHIHFGKANSHVNVTRKLLAFTFVGNWSDIVVRHVGTGAVGGGGHGQGGMGERPPPPSSSLPVISMANISSNASNITLLANMTLVNTTNSTLALHNVTNCNCIPSLRLPGSQAQGTHTITFPSPTETIQTTMAYEMDSPAKMFTALYSLVGIALVAGAFGLIMDYILERQEQMLAQEEIESEEPKDGANQSSLSYVSVGMATSLVVLNIVAGTVFFGNMNNDISFVDAFYFSIVTMATIGYGDVHPRTEAGKIFSCFWIPLGTVLTARAIGAVLDLYLQERQRKLSEKLMRKPIDLEDILQCDVDGDGVLSETEFILFKLQKMGKVDSREVADIAEHFRSIGGDDGWLTREEAMKNLAKNELERKDAMDELKKVKKQHRESRALSAETLAWFDSL